MFTGPEPAIRSMLNGFLAVAAVLYAIGAIAIVIAVRAEPMRARFYARLAGIVKAGPLLVGLACLGFMMDAVDLRTGHEADVVTRWPALLPQVAALAAGAAFLAGLLAGARTIRTAIATGGPMALLSALVWMAAAWFLVSLEREKAGVLGELQRSAPDSVTSFFRYLTLFPIVTILVAGAGACLGRLLHGLLGLPTDEQQGSRPPVVAAAPLAFQTVPPFCVASPSAPRPPVSTPSPPPLPTTEPLVPGPAPAWRLPPLARPRPQALTARWPSLLLIALGALLMVPAGCDLLTQKARLVASDPAGGVMLSGAPSDVSLTFSDELSPSSTITVRRTVTLDWAGREEATGGTPVADASGESALSIDRRTLRVRLPEQPPGGLYVVDWTSVRARSNDERYGDLYFGVRMEVPRFIRDGGAPRERDPYERDRRAALAGGVILIMIGLAWRWYAIAAQE